MSYYTQLSGMLAILPPLSSEAAQALAAALGADTSWRVSSDGTRLMPIDVPTRTYYWEELQAAIDTHLKPKHRLSGEIGWEGEQEGDTGTLRVVRGRVKTTPDAQADAGPEVAQHILALLESGDPPRMKEAVERLGALKRSPPGVIAAVRPLLQHPSPVTRQCAIETLREVRAKTPPIIAALMECLADPHEWVRSAAAGTLGELGEAALPAIPALEHLQDDPSYGPRGRAAEALDQLRPLTK